MRVGGSKITEAAICSDHVHVKEQAEEQIREEQLKALDGRQRMTLSGDVVF